MTPSTLAAWLPRRRRHTHKGHYGRVLIIAGSRSMSGAAVLAAQAALRTGSGLVYLAVPRSVQPLVVRKLTEVITIPVAETSAQTFTPRSLTTLRPWLTRVDAVAVGPGLTTHAQTVTCVRRLLPLLRVPTVLDADALNACAQQPAIFQRSHAPLVLTPHPGELCRLTGLSAQAIQRDRRGVSQRYAKRWQATVVLKGHHTVIALPTGRSYVNRTGNPGMASAGMGDVLTGMLASLLGQGLTVERACRLAAHLHGLAGDLAARRCGEAGLIASDIIAIIPLAIKKLRMKN